MKTCKVCKAEKPVGSFRIGVIGGKPWVRKTCYLCEKAQKRSRRTAEKKAPGPGITPETTAIPAESIDPLKDAYDRFDARSAQRSASAREKALIEENRRLHRAVEELGKMQASPTIIIYDKAKELRSDATACAIASDWHVEETVDGAAVHGLNNYNLDVAKSRSEHFFRNLLKLTDIVARDSKVTTIFLAGLGDFFSGHIHEELIANTSLAPGEAAQFCKGLICSGIEFLLRESSYIIDGELIPGNHGRMTDQVWIGNPTGTSLETFMYHAITDRFYGNPRVRIHVASQAMVYRKFYESFTMRMIHGYECKYGGGIGGLTIPLRKALSQWDNPIRANLTLLGHFHQRLDGGNFMVNGSLIGYNTYAQFIKASFEEAVQSFFVISARGGGEKSIVAPIWLSDKVAA